MLDAEAAIAEVLTEDPLDRLDAALVQVLDAIEDVAITSLHRRMASQLVDTLLGLTTMIRDSEPHIEEPDDD